jgi:hypothetical protein
VSRHALPKRLPKPTEPVPPLVAEIRDIVLRHLDQIDRFRWTYDAVEAAAFRVLAIRDIAAGLRATSALAELAPRLTALDARHQPRTWGDSDIRVCDACQVAWPCTDRLLLDGELAEVAS